MQIHNSHLWTLAGGFAMVMTISVDSASAAIVVSFQQGVSPGGAYTTDGTYISDVDATANFDADPDNELIVGSTTTNAVYRGLLEFDVSAIPATDTINSVSLILTTRGGAPGIGGTQTYNLYSYALDFSETDATWTNPDLGDADVAGGSLGTLLSSVTLDLNASGTVATFADSAAFRSALSTAVADDGFLRLILVGNESQDSAHQFARFASDENSTLASRPELVIDSVPEPGSLALLGLGGLLAFKRWRCEA